MTETLDDRYLAWLYSQVGDVKVSNKSETYWELFRQLDSHEFVWFVPNDDNRVEDGRALRYEWAVLNGIATDSLDQAPGCSFLEMMIGITRHLVFEGDGHANVWFWHLIDNLGLQYCTDHIPYNREEVDDRINAVIWRTYDKNGRGGLFPLRRARKDQREVELWYQMSAYLLEG